MKKSNKRLTTKYNHKTGILTIEFKSKLMEKMFWAAYCFIASATMIMYIIVAVKVLIELF